MLNKIKSYFQKIKDRKDFNKGVEKLDNGFYKESADILITLVDSPHLNKEILYFNLSGALIGQDDLEQGEKYLNKAIEIDENQDYLWATLAEINIMQKKWDSAEKAIKKAISLEPNKKIYESKKEVICGSKELKENYRKHFKLLQKSVEEQKNENWEKAIQLLKESVEHYDKNGYIYNQIGAIYINNFKDKELAAEYFKKAIEKEPENDIYKKNLKLVLK